MSSNAYRILGTVGQVSTVVTAVLTTIMAIFCVVMGVRGLRTATPPSAIVEATVVRATAGCKRDADPDQACTVTARYAWGNEMYEAKFSAMGYYEPGDLIQVAVPLEDPAKAVQRLPSPKLMGTCLLVMAVVSVWLAVALARFAQDSANFAAGAGLLTFLRVVFPF